MDKGELSRPAQWLIEQFQDVNFGSITFVVDHGVPDLAQPYRVVRTVKISGGENGPRPELKARDFELRREHTALFTKLKHLPNGCRVTVKLMYGLPTTSIDIEEDHRAA